MLKIPEILKFQDVNDYNKLPKVSNVTYNYLLGVVMLYMMFMILSGLMIYKVVAIGPFLAPASVFVTPMIYCLSNVVTEVYGYQVGRNMMWWFVISSAIFTGISVLIIQFPSPPNFNSQPAFDLIFGSMPRVFVAGILGTVCGMSFNNVVVSKFKIIMEGKRYWFRSLVSTCGGEVVYNIIAYPIMYLGRFPVSQVGHILLCVSCYKILMTMIFLPPECLLARFLKIKEKLNVFDYNVNYSIFRFKLSENSSKPSLKIVT